MDGISLRREVRPDDIHTVEAITASSGFFSPAEIEIAKELVAEALAQGPAAGYFFIFAELGENCPAYACYGPDDSMPGKFHLYWIAVREDFRGQGLGGRLIEAAEHDAWAEGADYIAVETSSRAQYAPSRNFYERHGYTRKEAHPNHYGPGDHLLIYVKYLGAPETELQEDGSAWDEADA